MTALPTKTPTKTPNLRQRPAGVRQPAAESAR